MTPPPLSIDTKNNEIYLYYTAHFLISWNNKCEIIFPSEAESHGNHLDITRLSTSKYSSSEPSKSSSSRSGSNDMGVDSTKNSFPFDTN